MDLDDVNRFRQLDEGDFYTHIRSLPDQVLHAWEEGQQHPLPDAKDVQRVIIAGLGGSAIGGDLLAAYAAATCPLPIVVHRDYGLPGWATGPQTLVVASSHSGNTEETISSFEQARKNDCRLLVISTGGQLEEMARQTGTAHWKFVHTGQPRAAVGWSFSLLLALAVRLGWLADPTPNLEAAVREMKTQQTALERDVPVFENPAKRMAGQLVGRFVGVFGSGLLAVVARRWKGQLSEVSKAWAQFEALPEMDHNSLAGLVNPSELLERSAFIFLRSANDHPRNALRGELTRKAFMQEGLYTDVYQARGTDALANLWTALHFGDFVSYYLAMAYGSDPTEIDVMNELKAALKATG